MKKSFTLIELLVVIVMIAILLAMGLWVLISARQTRSLPTVADKVGGLITSLEGFARSPSAQLTHWCEPGENSSRTAVIDRNNGYAYFGTHTSPGQIIKIDLNNFQRVGAITLKTDEGYLNAAVIDQSRGFAYFGTDTSPAKIIKIDIDPTRTFQEIGLPLTLRSGESFLTTAVIDQDYAFFSASISNQPSPLVRIVLSNFTESTTTINLPGAATSVVLDPDSHMAYYEGGKVLNQTTSYIYKVNLNAYSLVGSKQLASGEYNDSVGIVKKDTAIFYKQSGQPFAYFTAMQSSQSKIIKFDLTTFSELPGYSFTSDKGNPQVAVVDQNTGYAYYSNYLNTSPRQLIIVKINLATLTDISSPLSYHSYFTGAQEHYQMVMITDQQKYIYPLTDSNGGQGSNWTAPSTLYKIDLDSFNVQDHLSFDQSNDSAFALNAIGIHLYSPKLSSGVRFLIARECANNSNNMQIASSEDYPTFLGDTNIPSNIKFVDGSENEVNYYVRIITRDNDPSKIGNVSISIVDKNQTVITPNREYIRMTDGSGAYYRIYIANNGSVSVKKE